MIHSLCDLFTFCSKFEAISLGGPRLTEPAFFKAQSKYVRLDIFLQPGFATIAEMKNKTGQGAFVEIVANK